MPKELPAQPCHGTYGVVDCDPCRSTHVHVRPKAPRRLQPRVADEPAIVPPTAPTPFAPSLAPAPAGARAPDRLDGQLAAAVLQRAVLARRTTSPHANVLEFDSTLEAREKMGVQAFAQFQRWLLNDADLEPILRIDPAPVRQFLVASLMNRFAGSDIPYIKNVLNRLAKPPLSIEQVVMLTPPRAAWETRALPDDKARLRVVDCAEDLLALRAGDASEYDQVLNAARAIAIDKLADELNWYRVWLVDHDQAFASSAVLVAGTPTVAERIELIEALKSPSSWHP